MTQEMAYSAEPRKPLNIRQDLEYGYVEIEGQRYSFELLLAWGKDGLPVGKTFRIVSRDADGAMFLEVGD